MKRTAGNMETCRAESDDGVTGTMNRTKTNRPGGQKQERQENREQETRRTRHESRRNASASAKRSTATSALGQSPRPGPRTPTMCRTLRAAFLFKASRDLSRPLDSFLFVFSHLLLPGLPSRSRMPCAVCWRTSILPAVYMYQVWCAVPCLFIVPFRLLCTRPGTASETLYAHCSRTGALHAAAGFCPLGRKRRGSNCRGGSNSLGRHSYGVVSASWWTTGRPRIDHRFSTYLFPLCCPFPPPPRSVGALGPRLNCPAPETTSPR